MVWRDSGRVKATKNRSSYEAECAECGEGNSQHIPMSAAYGKNSQLYCPNSDTITIPDFGATKTNFLDAPFESKYKTLLKIVKDAVSKVCSAGSLTYSDNEFAALRNEAHWPGSEESTSAKLLGVLREKYNRLKGEIERLENQKWSFRADSDRARRLLDLAASGPWLPADVQGPIRDFLKIPHTISGGPTSPVGEDESKAKKAAEYFESTRPYSWVGDAMQYGVILARTYRELSVSGWSRQDAKNMMDKLKEKTEQAQRFLVDLAAARGDKAELEDRLVCAAEMLSNSEAECQNQSIEIRFLQKALELSRTRGKNAGWQKIETAPKNAGWQKIETAPKDGRFILLGWESGSISIGRFDEEWRCWKEGGYAMCSTMTHWMPLPEAPK